VLVGDWTRQMFEAVVVAEAAAMLHLEIALGVALANPAGALLHIALGERLIAAPQWVSAPPGLKSRRSSVERPPDHQITRSPDLQISRSNYPEPP